MGKGSNEARALRLSLNSVREVSSAVEARNLFFPDLESFKNCHLKCKIFRDLAASIRLTSLC